MALLYLQRSFRVTSLDKDKLALAAENIAAAKNLQKSESAVDDDALVPTLGCVFAFGSTLSPGKLCDHYIETIEKHGIDSRIDVILVLDKYVATLVAKLPRGEWTPTILRPPNKEGTHLGTGTLACAEESLDVFFRLLLAHLAMFRQMVPHPGFRFRHTSWRISYFDSVTHESDPDRRAAKLLSYRRSVVREFRRLSRSG